MKTKLTLDERLSVSTRITKLTELNQKSIAEDTAMYLVDWNLLIKTLDCAIYQYECICR